MYSDDESDDEFDSFTCISPPYIRIYEKKESEARIRRDIVRYEIQTGLLDPSKEPSEAYSILYRILRFFETIVGFYKVCYYI